MRPNKQETRMSNDSRIAVLETTILNINSSLLDMKRSFDKIDHKFESLENKIDNKFETFENKMDKKFDVINNRLWSNFLWLMGMIVGLAGLIAHTQHWI